MSRPQHYSPAIERFLVSVLYHEARYRKIPMTRLVDDIIKNALANSTGWQLAMQSVPSPDQPSVGRTACDLLYGTSDESLEARSFSFFMRLRTWIYKNQLWIDPDKLERHGDLLITPSPDGIVLDFVEEESGEIIASNSLDFDFLLSLLKM